jgi:predicted nucleic acid-binding protein
VKIVLDTTILVRANEHTHGLARELLTTIVESEHTLLVSNEMLFELAKVLRYSRLQAFYEPCQRTWSSTTSISSADPRNL